MRRQVKGEAVRRELLPGTSPALLKELHLLTRAGDLNADSLRKLKQVNHLVGLLAPALDDVLGRFGDPVIADCGAGKSYLGFVLYELFLARAGKGRLLALESRPELARAGAERAARLGFERLRFVEGSIEGADVPARLHVVTALHACDTATDDALLLAVRHGADHVAVVPCCQAEVARQLGTQGDQGVVVAEVTSGGPAARAGLQRGDVILSVNQKPVATPQQVAEIIGRMKDGEMALLRVRRGNQAVFVPVPVGGRPYSSAVRKSSSIISVSSLPIARWRACSMKRARGSSGSLSSEKALAISRPVMNSSKRSVSHGQDGIFLASGETSTG